MITYSRNVRIRHRVAARTDEIAGWNRDLEARVAAQVAELERMGKLQRFLAPQFAELIVSQGDERSSKAIAARSSSCSAICAASPPLPRRAEPEEVLDLLREYHGALGPLVVRQFEGTLDQFSGDGIMVFFNDPLPTPDPAERAFKWPWQCARQRGS